MRTDFGTSPIKSSSGPPNLCNCTEEGWIGGLCEISEQGCPEPPNPPDWDCKDKKGRWWFYDQPQACGPHGWCVAQNKCLCKQFSFKT